MSRELSRELLTFLHKSPSSFHAVYNLGQMLEEDGYTEDVYKRQTVRRELPKVGPITGVKS